MPGNELMTMFDLSLLSTVELDPQTYNGKLRIATGLACLKGIEMVNRRLHEVNLPFKVFHGLGDRVTNPRWVFTCT